MSSILLVEDDLGLGQNINDFLVMEGFTVNWVKSLAEGKSVNLDDTSLIILDWMLPDGQGIDMLKDVREKNTKLPIIMLTAKTELIDKVLGLESGANDYVTKPFEPRELLARIRVQLRSKDEVEQKVEDDTIIEIASLSIDRSKREVHWEGKLVELTKMEFDFLTLLAQNPNRAISRDEILNKVWGYDCYPSTRTVDTHVLQLRQKLSEALIETVRGIGYKLRA
jgi:DNA-binding response OmpR family regulator